MSIEKVAVRTQLKQQREAMAPAVVAADSKTIIDKLLHLVDWSTAHNVHTYLPKPGKNEIDTQLFVTALQETYPHITIATWQDDHTFASVWFGTNNMRAMVPANFQFDVIIVPLLGFNDKGFRIGFGGGFYDRFLATQQKAITIGLGYESGYTSFTPESQDIALKVILTEKSTIQL